MTSTLIFGKYEIQHRLAIGGMGEVFAAVQRGVSGFERPVILKSLLPDLAQQKDLVDQFLDEARVAATLNHPNVVSIFEVGLWNGTFYIAMEFISGRNLSQLMRRAIEQQQRIPPQVAARIIRDAALGLDHAHNAHDASGRPLHIVHRDISPQNIMLREDGVTKVVDFGIASAANRSTRTATGMIKGKLAYMPPEQVHSQPMTPLVDQYALGVVFWELLTCRRLFKAENDLELIKLVMAGVVERPDRLMPDVQPALADAVMRMISLDPQARFASLAEVAEVLDTMLDTQTPGLTPAALMRRLGSGESKVSTAPPPGASDNFVISLAQRQPPPSEEVDLSTGSMAQPATPEATGVLIASGSPVSVVPAPPAKKRGPLLLLGVLVVLALGVGAAAQLVGRGPAPVDVAPLAVRNDPHATAPDAAVALAVVPDAAVSPPAVPVAAAQLTVVTVPTGAALRFDGRQLGMAPQHLEVTPDGTHYLAAERRGFERTEVELVLKPGESREVTLELKALKVATRAPVVPQKVPEVTAVGPGFLTIDTDPWTKVSVDDEPIGSTPINKKRLSAGSHRLVLINEGANLNVTRSVVIPSGENVKLRLKLP